jgi:hypothetical protein
MFAQLENLELDDKNPSFVENPQSSDWQVCTSFFTLQTLRLDFRGSYTAEDIADLLTWLRLLIGECQANLDTLMLAFSFAVGPKTLAWCLGQAESLKTLHLISKIAHQYQSDDNCVKILSGSCKSLKEVWLSCYKFKSNRNFCYYEEITSMIRVNRGDFGEGVRLVREFN